MALISMTGNKAFALSLGKQEWNGKFGCWGNDTVAELTLAFWVSNFHNNVSLFSFLFISRPLTLTLFLLLFIYYLYCCSPFDFCRHNGENWRKRKGLALIIVKELGIPTLFQISNSIFSIVCFGGVGDKPITPSIQGSAPHFENWLILMFFFLRATYKL